MDAHNLKAHNLKALDIAKSRNDEYDNIPLDISDILNICKEYNKLGMQIQFSLENIIELGINDSIKIGAVKEKSLPFIKEFLEQITKNAYFGDSVYQAKECIMLIKQYEFSKINSLKLN